ncbi:septation protein SepH [Branchiibius sp. NY16-3462-2]|uniref:septation protein SepH n=1 Tax=Branchiibius sp. NY16-3462-2 TaxID=1807500 RepID=UPI00079A55A1|nr:septation protein SepH [Branchiibius sp. NY16-3462-2]KYH44077.1 hypothetical protein AZH51_04875 [Branchiibius sp. NY16-3462-2]
MSELHFTRVSDDGGQLVLSDDNGAEFTLALSDELRATLRRAPRPAAQLPELAAPATAKDVQSMLRAGGTVHEVAERTGWEVSRVERYEPPIRSERQYVSSLVQGLPTPEGTFAEQVAERLAGRGVDAEELDWDAVRDVTTNAWTVVCAFEAGGRARRAEWAFDPSDRRAVPIDDESRWLSEDDSPAGLIPAGRVAAPYDVIAEGGLEHGAAAPPRRPGRPAGPFSRSGEPAPQPAAAEPEPTVVEDDDTAPLAAAAEPQQEPEQDGAPVDLVSAIRRRGANRRNKQGRQRSAAATEPPAENAPAREPEATPTDADEIDPVTGTVDLFTQVDDPTPPEQVLTEALAQDDFADAELYDDDISEGETVIDEDTQIDLDDAPTVGGEVIDEDDATDVPERPSASRSGRPSVPSWDDIMFGRRARD